MFNISTYNILYVETVEKVDIQTALCTWIFILMLIIQGWLIKEYINFNFGFGVLVKKKLISVHN